MTHDADLPLTSRVTRLLRRAYALTRRRPSRRTQRVLLAVASVFFIGGTWASVRALDIAASDVSWGPLAVAGLVLVPLTILANAEEYRISGRILGKTIPHSTALRVTFYATAANLLPLPGAFVVRTQALSSLGAGARRAASATAVVGVGWIGVSLTLGGGLLALAGNHLIGAAIGVTGLVTLVVTQRWLRSQFGGARSGPTVAWLLVVEATAVAIDAGRLVLVLAGLGIEADLGSAFVLAVSGSLASATGILPGGFGIREGIAAGLAPLVGLPVTAGFIATAVNRVLGLAVLAPATGLGAVFMGRSEQSAETPDHPTR